MSASLLISQSLNLCFCRFKPVDSLKFRGLMSSIRLKDGKITEAVSATKSQPWANVSPAVAWKSDTFPGMRHSETKKKHTAA